MVGNKLLTLLTNTGANLNLTDMDTYCKFFRPEVLRTGISYFGRTDQEGKKIGWCDGFRALYAIIKYNLFR